MPENATGGHEDATPGASDWRAESDTVADKDYRESAFQEIEDEAETPKRAEAGLAGWIDCFPKSRLVGTLFCGGVNDPREIEGNAKLQKAFEFGKAVR